MHVLHNLKSIFDILVPNYIKTIIIQKIEMKLFPFISDQSIISNFSTLSVGLK